MKLLLSILVCLCTSSVVAQNSIKGSVIDSVTREPVPFANVYFAGSTIGTITNADGKFELTGFPSGKYDLTASFLGFYPVQRSFAFDNSQHVVTLVLLEKAVQLEEVVIRPDNRNRPYDLATFKTGFLGTTKNTVSTKIKNEDDLDFDFEPQKKFTAITRKPLEIINEALGYKLIYDLQHFEINYTTNTQLFLGIPRFENLSEKIKPRWERERRRAYYGSMMHFIHLLKSGSMNDEYNVFEFFRKPNPDRPTADVLKEKIKYWGLNQLAENGVIRNKSGATDSLNYYLELNRKPEFIDIIGRRITDVTSLMSADRNTFTYTGMLYIVYTKEEEDANFAAQNRRKAMPNQSSVIHFFEPIQIYDNGYFEATQSVFFEGYMGWAEKISDMLPLGYKPSPE